MCLICAKLFIFIGKLPLCDTDNQGEQTLQVIVFINLIKVTVRLLIRWSRVRISPDPPVIQRDHRNVVPFLLVSGNVVTTRKQ